MTEQPLYSSGNCNEFDINVNYIQSGYFRI